LEKAAFQSFEAHLSSTAQNSMSPQHSATAQQHSDAAAQRCTAQHSNAARHSTAPISAADIQYVLLYPIPHPFKCCFVVVWPRPSNVVNEIIEGGRKQIQKIFPSSRIVDEMKCRDQHWRAGVMQ